MSVFPYVHFGRFFTLTLCVLTVLYINLLSSFTHGSEEWGGNAALIYSGAAVYCSLWANPASACEQVTSISARREPPSAQELSVRTDIS